MKRMATICVVALCLAPRLAGAQQISVSPVLHAIAAEEAASTAPAHPAVNQTPAPAPAFVYSDGYHTRLKIHKIASVAMIPLVATEGVLGKMLYDNPTSSRRSAHQAVALGIGGVFGVNTITGTWNLIEGRKDPNGRTRRVIHSILMLASDAGFLAAAMTHPSSHDQGATYFEDRTTHRNLAIASISTATVGYLIMLFK